MPGFYRLLIRAFTDMMPCKGVYFVGCSAATVGWLLSRDQALRVYLLCALLGWIMIMVAGEEYGIC